MIEIAAAPSSVPSVIFALIALLGISVVVLFILRYFLPLRTTPAYLLVPVFFALWLPASMVLLVPIDLASSAMVDDVDARGIWLDTRTLTVSWRITYWLTFALTWYAVLRRRAVAPLLVWHFAVFGSDCPLSLGSFSPSSPSTPTPDTANRRASCSTPSARMLSTMPSSLDPEYLA